jgi:hypothetical protein
MKYGILMNAGHFEPEAPLLLAQRHRDGRHDADEDEVSQGHCEAELAREDKQMQITLCPIGEIQVESNPHSLTTIPPWRLPNRSSNKSPASCPYLDLHVVILVYKAFTKPSATIATAIGRVHLFLRHQAI